MAVACIGVAVTVLTCCGGSSVANQAPAGVWRAESSGTQQRLYDVACLSALQCLAVGQAGTIISTADGGSTWRPQVSPLHSSSDAFYRIACIAPASCYVIARPDTIFVTHDGGAAWSSHVLPVAVSGASLTDAACLPDYTPISGRPALCRLGLLDIACVSADVCYAVATAPSAYDNQPTPATARAAPSSIWMTADGGATWTSQPVPPGVACDGDCAAAVYGYPLVWVTCLSSGVCRAGGGHVLGCGHCGFASAVLVTSGPGMPWACAGRSPACTILSPDAADCPAGTTCYGIQSTNPFGQANSVFRSTDGGASWVQTGPDWPASVLNDMACPDDLTCYIAGSGGLIARITNGSTVAVAPSPATGDLFGITCAERAACYAVGDGGEILALRAS